MSDEVRFIDTTLRDGNQSLWALNMRTGAMLPAGCDAVIPVERVLVADGKAQLEEGLEVQPGQYIHARASDLKQGALLLNAGIRLDAPEVAAAAGAGMARLRVSQQPACMIVSTGNELVEPGEPIQDWQLRRSNAYGLVAALRRRGFARVADDHLPDDAEGSVEETVLLKQAFIKDSSKTIEDLVKTAIGTTGENIRIRRFTRFELGQ